MMFLSLKVGHIGLILMKVQDELKILKTGEISKLVKMLIQKKKIKLLMKSLKV